MVLVTRIMVAAKNQSYMYGYKRLYGASARLITNVFIYWFSINLYLVGNPEPEGFHIFFKPFS